MNAIVEAPPAATATIAELVLVRYLLSNATPKKVREDLGKLLPAEPTAAEFDRIRAELASAGLLSKRPRKAYALTEEGRRRAMQFLGLSEMPARMNWGMVIAQHLFPRAAGLSSRATTKLEGDKLAALLVKRKYGLSGTVGSTMNQVLEALACKQLDFPQETTLTGVLEAVLSKLLGSEKRLTKDELARQLPLFGTGHSKFSAEAARRDVVREWLMGAKASLPSEVAAEPFDLHAFAATVLALAAGSPPEDRFHDNKVFIAPLWARSQCETSFPRLTLPEFKQRLIEANAKHLLHLSRADLVQAMDPTLVAESETTYLNATFHFILLEESHP